MPDAKHIGVVGLGLMGSSITAAVLAAGYHVSGVTKIPSECDESAGRIAGYLEQSGREGLFSESPELVLKRLTVTSDLSALADCSIILESITEDALQKKEVFARLEKIIAPEAIIGSNTSAIPVTLLQEGLRHPGRLFGIHWAEPAHITRFMEVICGKQTAPQHATTIMSFASSLGKEPSLLKKDIRGFITNRIMYAMLREAFHLVEKGYATVEDVDRSLRNDLGYWITFAGPFRFMDITGIPAYLTVMEDLFPDLDNNVAPPATIQHLVANGAKGTSNAKGFYNYTPESAHRWEELFVEFSYEIRKLAARYPENIGDTTQ